MLSGILPQHHMVRVYSDSLGGTVKRSAYKASLQEKMILNPMQFFKNAIETHPGKVT